MWFPPFFDRINCVKNQHHSLWNGADLPRDSAKGGIFLNEIAVKQAVPMAAPYQRKIGKVIFQVSAFGNPQAKETGQEMILRMLENKLTFEKQEKEEDCA